MARIDLYYRLIRRNKEGKVVHKTRKRKSKSFVLQFMQLLEAAMITASGGSEVSIKDITNTDRDIVSHLNNLAVKVGSGSVERGVVVGTGVAAEDNLDYQLAALIAHGTGSGELQYNGTTVGAAAEIGANVDMVITGSFTNGSGTTIVVTEIGIQAYGYYTANAHFLIVRDLLAAGESVPNTETLTVEYTLRTTV